MDKLFRYIPGRSTMVECTVCGRRGYSGGRWQDKCVAGHPHICKCGRKFSTKSGLAAHERKGHVLPDLKSAFKEK